MRTTIDVDDELLLAVKRLAAETGRPIARVIEDALRESLSRRRERASLEKVRLTTFLGDGLQPGIDLDDSASLLDVMDRPQ